MATSTYHIRAVPEEINRYEMLKDGFVFDNVDELQLRGVLTLCKLIGKTVSDVISELLKYGKTEVTFDYRLPN